MHLVLIRTEKGTFVRSFVRSFVGTCWMAAPHIAVGAPPPPQSMLLPPIDVFGTTRGRSRLKFCQRAVLDVPERPARPKNLQNELFLTNFRENFRDRRPDGTRVA